MFTDETEIAMQKFQRDITLEYGRYHVRFPWKSDEPDLPDNYALALAHFRSLSNRLAKDPNLLKQYADVM